LYISKGEDGHLIIRFNVEADDTVRREGNNLITKHYITLTEALLGCTIVVNTVSGSETLEYKPQLGTRHVLEKKGINGQGDHIVEIEVVMP
jgi:molecular chaperone DnaJ